MNILNVGHHNYIKGGSDRYMLELEALLRRNKHSVVPFATQDSQNLPSEWSKYFPPGIDTQSPGVRDAIRFLYSTPARRNLRQLLTKTRIDLAHLHIYYGQLTSSILEPLVRAGIPIVQSLHEYKLTCPVYTHVSGGQICEACADGNFYRAIVRHCNGGSFARTLGSVVEAYVSRALGSVRSISHFIAVSDFLRSRLIQHGVVEPDRVTTIHNFVDASSLSPANGPGRHFLYFGRLASVKGLKTLVDAAADFPNKPFKIAGSGPLASELGKQTAQAGSDHVEIVGFQSGDRLLNLIRESIAVIVPSEWYENCPMSILEALALGRPVIASSIGGIPELISDGQDGYLFPAGDVAALKDRIERMLMNPGEAAEMGKRGREKVSTLFGPTTHYSKLMAVYDKARG